MRRLALVLLGLLVAACATIEGTGPRPSGSPVPPANARHLVLISIDAGDGGSRWYEEAADLRAPALWAWARAAGLTTAAVSWPSTLNAPIDWLVAERDDYRRADPLPQLIAASTPKDIQRWDAFLTATAAGIAGRATMIVTGDHGFQDVRDYVYPNRLLVDAGLRACPGLDGWCAAAHVGGGSAAVFVNPPGDAEPIRRAEAAPGWAIGSSCDRALIEPAVGGLVGTDGFLPSRASMATGFVAAGAGIRLIDIAPTAARLLGITAPPVEGRVLQEILT